ncbi:MAG: N-acetylmuramoyl-L-alanine amidase [Solirubrobacteraceae bacterium]|nr:N-acetylmuramoyl-L-alanine amidase [Solirubrobacteraceae bacterium]
MSSVININDRDERVRAHQGHLNDRLRAHGDGPIAVTGICDAATVRKSALAAWFLGAEQQTVTQVLAGSISVGVQDMVADPDARGPEQRRRARDRRGKPMPGTRMVLVQAGHLAPREPGFPATGTDGEQQLVKAIRDRLVKILNADGRFVGLPVPGDIPDGVTVDAALFLHADGVDDPSAGGFQFGFPVTEPNKKLVAHLRQQFLGLPGHPKSRRDNSTEDAHQYFGFKRVKSPFKVLVEHGFLTNPTERQWLKANVGNLARAEYEALCRTFAMTPVAEGATS